MSEVKDVPKDVVNWPTGVIPPEGAVTGSTVAEVIDKADDAAAYSGYVDLIDDFVRYDPERKTYFLDEKGLNHQITYARFRAQARIDCGTSPTEECLTASQIEQIGKDIEDNRAKYDESIAALQASLQPFQDTLVNDPMMKMGMVVAGGLGAGLVLGLGIQSIGHGPFEDVWNVLRKQYQYLQEYYVRAELNRKYSNDATPEQRAILKNCGFDFSNLPKNTIELVRNNALKALGALTVVMMGVAALGYGASELFSSDGESLETNVATQAPVADATSSNASPAATPGNAIPLPELLAQNEAALGALSEKAGEAEDLADVVKDIRINLTSGNPEEARRLYDDNKTGFKAFNEDDFQDPQVLALYHQYDSLFEQVFSLSDDDLKNRTGQTSLIMTVAGVGAGATAFMFMQGSTAEKIMDDVYEGYRSLRFRAGVGDIEKYLDDVVEDAWRQALKNGRQGGQCTDVELRLADFENVYGLDSAFNPNANPAPFPLPKPVEEGEEDAAPAPASASSRVVVSPNAVPAVARATGALANSAASFLGVDGAMAPGNLATNGAGNYARGGVPETNASFRVANANAPAPEGWVRLPGGGGAVPASEVPASTPKPARTGSPRPVTPEGAPVTARGMAGTAAGTLATTVVVAGAEIYLDDKMDEWGVPEENQDGLFDATNYSLLGYAVYTNPVTAGGLPWAYLGGDLAATETRPLVEAYVPEPLQDTVTQATGVVGGGTGLVAGMGITYTIGAAAGGTTLLEISILGGPVTILAGAIGYAVYQDYKQYRQLKETREYFLTQAPQAERDLFIGLCATLELGLQGELTHEKLQTIRTVLNKEEYQSFLDQYGQYFADAYLDPFISDYTAIPHVPPAMLLPVLLASDSPSAQPSTPHRDYTLDLSLIRDEILHPYADEAYAELYPYTDSLTGLPSAISPAGVTTTSPPSTSSGQAKSTAPKSDTTLVSMATPQGGQTTSSPTPTQKPYTTDSAEPRLIYDLTKRGDAIYDGLVKQYPFDEPNLLLKVFEQCKTLHANERYTIAAQILNRWLMDAQKYLSNEQASLTGAFKSFTGFSVTGIVDQDEARDLNMNHVFPLEEQIAQYAHGEIMDINEVLGNMSQFAEQMSDAMGWDVWKDLL